MDWNIQYTLSFIDMHSLHWFCRNHQEFWILAFAGQQNKHLQFVFYFVCHRQYRRLVAKTKANQNKPKSTMFYDRKSFTVIVSERIHWNNRLQDTKSERKVLTIIMIYWTSYTMLLFTLTGIEWFDLFCIKNREI